MLYLRLFQEERQRRADIEEQRDTATFLAVCGWLLSAVLLLVLSFNYYS